MEKPEFKEFLVNEIKQKICSLCLNLQYSIICNFKEVIFKKSSKSKKNQVHRWNELMGMSVESRRKVNEQEILAPPNSETLVVADLSTPAGERYIVAESTPMTQLKNKKLPQGKEIESLRKHSTFPVKADFITMGFLNEFNCGENSEVSNLTFQKSESFTRFFDMPPLFMETMRRESKGEEFPLAFFLKTRLSFFPENGIKLAEELGENICYKFFKADYFGKQVAVKIVKSKEFEKQLEIDTEQSDLLSWQPLFLRIFKKTKIEFQGSLFSALILEYSEIGNFKSYALSKNKDEVKHVHTLSVIVSDVSNALHFLHSFLQTCLFNDLKMSNIILFTKDFEYLSAKLSDVRTNKFQVLYEQEVQEEFHAPEILEAKKSKKNLEFTPASNVFSLGKIVQFYWKSYKQTPENYSRLIGLCCKEDPKERILAQLIPESLYTDN